MMGVGMVDAGHKVTARRQSLRRVSVKHAPCTLCAYGSASVKAVENEAPPQVPDCSQIRVKEVAIVLDDNPNDENHFTLTDHNGREARFVFDAQSDKSDSARKVPQGKMKV